MKHTLVKTVNTALLLSMLCGSRCWSAGPAKALPDAGHPYVKNSRSKIDVLREWAKAGGSADYTEFADTLEELLPERERIRRQRRIPAETGSL